MSSYTMQLKTYIRQATQYQEGLTERERIEEGRKQLFDFDYPIFDENYRSVFETHFIRNFYMREIGFETEGLFKFQLETWLLINMPYFNKLFESELIEFDPLENSSIDVTHNKTNDRTQNDINDTTQNVTSTGSQDVTDSRVNDSTNDRTKDGTSQTTDDNFERDIKADTPDSRLNLTTNDGQGILEYASQVEESNENNARNTTANETTGDVSHTDESGETHSDSTSTSDATQNNTLNSSINDIEDFIQHRAGKIGVQTYSEMIQKYRESFLRIEKDMFKEMQELFMLVY